MVVVDSGRNCCPLVPQFASTLDLLVRSLVRVVGLFGSLLVHVQAEDRAVSGLLHPHNPDFARRLLAA